MPLGMPKWRGIVQDKVYGKIFQSLQGGRTSDRQDLDGENRDYPEKRAAGAKIQKPLA